MGKKKQVCVKTVAGCSLIQILPSFEELTPDELEITYDSKVHAVRYLESLINIWQKLRYLGRAHLKLQNSFHSIDDLLHGDCFDISIYKL